MSVIRWVKEAYDRTMPFCFIPDFLKTQGMCIKAAKKNPWMLEVVPDYFKMQEMCNDVVKKRPWQLKYVPDYFKTQEICNDVVETVSWALEYVPDRLKTQKICDDAARKGFFLRDVPEWFVAQQQLKILQYDSYNNDLIECFDGYKKRKAQKDSIKEELMHITWHPSRWWDWCVPEDEKKVKEIFFDHLIYFLNIKLSKNFPWNI